MLSQKNLMRAPDPRARRPISADALGRARARPGPAPTTTRAAPRRLRVDVIMNAIGIIFVGLELPFQLVVCFHFSTAIYI